MKATYGQDANTFTWAADRLELETGLTDVISRLKFEPVQKKSNQVTLQD